MSDPKASFFDEAPPVPSDLTAEGHDDGPWPDGDAESGQGSDFGTYGKVLADDERRRDDLHKKQVCLALLSYWAGLATLVIGICLAYRFSADLWEQHKAFLDAKNEKTLPEFRLFLIAYMTFKASFVAGLFTTGGLLMNGAKTAVQPQPHPQISGQG